MTEREAAAASARPLPPLPEPAYKPNQNPNPQAAMGCVGPMYSAAQVNALILADRAASAPQAVRMKHAELIRAALEGAQIEYNDGYGWKSANAVWAINMMTNPSLTDVLFRVNGLGIVPLAPQDTGEAT